MSSTLTGHPKFCKSECGAFMYGWQCPLCDEAISTGMRRNLDVLVQAHKETECPFRDIPAENRPLNKKDKEFLDELLVRW